MQLRRMKSLWIGPPLLAIGCYLVNDFILYKSVTMPMVWRQVRIGMSPAEVHDLLGKPSCDVEEIKGLDLYDAPHQTERSRWVLMVGYGPHDGRPPARADLVTTYLSNNDTITATIMQHVRGGNIVLASSKEASE